ncbi:MAG: hypothetical protein ABIJ56_23450 [Pseudomonadota bacterium]
MRVTHSALLPVVLAVLVSGCARPPTGKSVNDGAGAGPAETTGEHASQSAYPGAVVTTGDEGSKTTVTVEADGRVVVARDADGRELLRVDVIKECGSPAVGAPVVRNVSLEQGMIHVVMGKHAFATIDLATKTVECTGSD